MIVPEQVTLQNLSVYRAARLAALQDAPNAFGSTYAREFQFSDEEWIERTAKWTGENSILYLAIDRDFEENVAVGLAGSYLDTEEATVAHLISMWAAPTYRQRGVGRLLVNQIETWACPHGVRTLQLMVTSNNSAAILFYERLGFQLTGHTEPYPNNPALMEFQMAKPLL